MKKVGRPKKPVEEKMNQVRSTVKSETYDTMKEIMERGGMTETEFVRAALEYAIAQHDVDTSENPRQRAEEIRQMKLRNTYYIYRRWVEMPSNKRPRKGNGFVDGVAYQMMLPKMVQDELACSYQQAVELIKAVYINGEGHPEPLPRDIEAEAAREAAAKLFLNAMEADKGVDPLDRVKPEFAVKENEYANESAQWEEAQRLEKEMKEKEDDND